MGTYTWTITPNDIDREIRVWKDRNSGKLINGWDFFAYNYDAEQIINVLKYGKELNKSVLITCSNLFWKADIIYDNYSNNTNINNNNNANISNNNNTKNKDISNITTNDDGDKTKDDNLEINKEKPIAVNFYSLDQKIHFPMVCYSSDIFSSVVNKLCIEFPELKHKNILFIHNGDVKNTSITIEQNKIKNGENILLEYYE